MTPNLLPMATPDLLWQVSRNENAKSADERAAVLADPGFGKHFTDHMVDICWSEKGGWHRPAGAAVWSDFARPGGGGAALRAGDLRGAEGVPARGRVDLDVPTHQNGERMQRSAKRLALPELPVSYFLESLEQLIAVDGEWVPTAPETSLYLRPFMFAKEAFLGVRPAAKVNYYLIASPAGAYFHGGVTPVSIWLSTEYARAGKGGTGAAKTGGNYASSLVAQAEAYDHGCAQVLFLDGDGVYSRSWVA